MAVSERDLALLWEEVKCLRKKISGTVSTSGGYTDQLTSPGSSVYPNSYYDGCECIDKATIQPDPDTTCPTEADEGYTGLGDIATPPNFGDVFIFDAVSGVFALEKDSEAWENRNIGLVSTQLEHGCVDPWWYRKATANRNSVILWQCGAARLLRTPNSGKKYWQNRTPSDLPNSAEQLSDITFKQIMPNQFRQNEFITLVVYQDAETSWNTAIARTRDDGITWSWTHLAYDSADQVKGIWMTYGGNRGSLIYVTLWQEISGVGRLALMKLNNDDTITISSTYEMGNATYFEMSNYIYTASPYGPVDGTEIFVYGRMNNPQSLGLSHIIKSTNEGLDWSMIENTWDEDWCGSFKTSFKSGSSRHYYSVRNLR
jgi:hypothetical protein